jgi:multiple sugar transport system ATP-binding protein
MGSESGSKGKSAGLELIALTKRYEKSPVAAVNSISMTIREGEFVTLLGPSGCGKSTTLHLLAGLDVPTSGKIFLRGADVTELPAQQRDTALVFQDYALYPHMSVEQNIAFPLQLKRRRIPSSEVRQRVSQVMERMGISDLRARPPAELSGGQRQRVALARSIVRTPAAFLFDEPLSNLDSRLRVSMRIELKELHQNLGATMVYVTHDQAEAMVLSDRVAVMDKGTVQQFAPPLELYHRPANLFVAGFIGEFGTNILPHGSIQTRDGLHQFRWRDHLIALPDIPDVAVRDVSLGIRPENIEVCSVQSADVKGTLKVVEPYGDRTRVRVTVGDVEVIGAAPESFSSTPGSIVGLRITRPDRIMLFDGERGSILNHTRLGAS